ncbi:hypothetical protein [Actinomadura macrotermitis]|uniref:Uncharacterized protein n=1 Tax=Actinomadura macrotermitis TaxID=2585200 RepID=A0A7K0C4K9_9ACTN|nr:hypothetical protein [Actinomadura macrotermitis]MQY07754.1 hypothetical protein [Actinomadura macrotermitis]
MSACPGPCNRRRSGDEPGRPTEGEPIWCRRCASLVRKRLAELDDLAARTGAALDQRRNGPAERVSGSRSRPSPSSAVDDLDELLHTLLGWEDAYRETRRFAPRPRRGRYAPTLAACIAWLGAHVDGLLVFPGAADFGHEVLSLHRRLSARVAPAAPPRRPCPPCPECDLLTVKYDDTTDTARCRACGWTGVPAPAAGRRAS